MTWRLPLPADPRFFRSPTFFLLIGGMVLYLLGTLGGFFREDYYTWLTTAGKVVLALALLGLVIRLGRYIKNRLFFRVRNRILFFYLFAGLVPIVLVLLLATLVVVIFFGNLSMFIYRNELKNLSYRLHSINAGMVEILYNHPERIEDPEFVYENFRTVLASRAPELPDVSTLFYRTDDRGIMDFVMIDSSLGRKSFQGEFLPDWLQQLPFYGVIIKHYSLFLYSHTPILVNGQRYYVDLFIPFRKPLFNYLVAVDNLRSFVTVAEVKAVAGAPAQAVSYYAFSDFKGIRPAAIPPEMLKRVHDLVNAPDSGLYSMDTVEPLEATDWFTYETSPAANRQLWVHLKIPFSTIVRNLVSTSSTGEVLFQILMVLLYVFLAMEVASIIIGMLIIRSVTQSVHHLSKGTQELKKGNLNFKIPVRHSDELGELSRSFNTMTASIQSLLNEVADKQRIKRELEIAREVQQKFFPKFTPQLPGISLAGRCLPAREVSGDFFDFLPLAEYALDVVVGDISGKGISAALLMASLQSAIRAQPPLALEAHPADGRRLATLMHVLNRHLYVLTPPEKFATLCYLSLQADRQRVSYCNAGHETPLRISLDGRVERLSEGGTVLGAFPEMNFDVGEVTLAKGDILAVYTDGLLDAMSRTGEEFGEDRLISLLQELRHETPDQILDAVFQRIQTWSEGAPQHDDITLVIARQTGAPLPS
jgi:sigma-B regulation protein RsbU (phosphoserine phosphatase)